jgi:hypothetical protein
VDNWFTTNIFLSKAANSLLIGDLLNFKQALTEILNNPVYSPRIFSGGGKSANNLENIKPHELTPEHIWDYRVFLSREYLSKTKKSLKKTTQNYYLIALRALLSYFTAKDIDSLPSDKIKLSKSDKEKKSLSVKTVVAYWWMPIYTTAFPSKSSKKTII